MAELLALFLLCYQDKISKHVIGHFEKWKTKENVNF